MDRTVTRGDTPRKSYKLFNLSGGALDLAGCTVWLTVKPVPDDDPQDLNALLKHYIVFDAAGAVTDSNGFELGGIDPDPDSPTYDTHVTGAVNGVITHVLPQADSTLLPIGTFVYDIQVKGPDLPEGDPFFETPVQSAKFTVLPDVTRRITTP